MKLKKYLYQYLNPTLWLLCHPGDLRKGIHICKHAKETGRYLSTLPRSGTVYLTSILIVAVDLREGGKGDYTFQDDVWIYNRDLLWSSVYHNFVAQLKINRPFDPDLIMIAHHPVQKTNILNIKKMKCVFTVRNPLDQLESWVMHTFHKADQQDRFIEEGYVERTIDYFNYWGRLVEEQKSDSSQSFLCVRYEQLVQKPADIVEQIAGFWNLDIERKYIDRAVFLCSREEMKKKIPADRLGDNKRVSVRDNRGRLFTDKNMDYIQNALCSKLKYDFGYDLPGKGKEDE